MAYFLAVDAGGTKADFLLADETRELARVRTGTIKRMRAGAATVQRNLDEALASLTAISGVSMRSITRTCIGTAGESGAATRNRLSATWPNLKESAPCSIPNPRRRRPAFRYPASRRMRPSATQPRANWPGSRARSAASRNRTPLRCVRPIAASQCARRASAAWQHAQ